MTGFVVGARRVGADLTIEPGVANRFFVTCQPQLWQMTLENALFNLLRIFFTHNHRSRVHESCGSGLYDQPSVQQSNLENTAQQTAGSKPGKPSPPHRSYPASVRVTSSAFGRSRVRTRACVLLCPNASCRRAARDAFCNQLKPHCGDGYDWGTD